MTPIEFANTLAADLATLPLPQPVYAQMGDIIVDCAGTTVSVMITTEQEMVAGGMCDVIEMADLIVIAARECADVSNDDGTTDHVAMDAVSAAMSADSVVLKDWADKMMALSWWRLGRPSITYMIQGGIAFATLSVTLPIP